jgi:DnaK suppressor protein
MSTSDPGTREHHGTAPEPRAHPDAELTVAQADELYRVLLETRRRLLEKRQEHLDLGRFTTERVAEPEEAAAWDTSQSTLIDLAESERLLLAQVERALHKMQDGAYGVSEDSGEPIGYDRLRAVPWARLSAADQEEVERRSRERGR